MTVVLIVFSCVSFISLVISIIAVITTKGVAGQKGDTGKQGQQGETGPKDGLIGDRGLEGVQGDIGPEGKDMSIIPDSDVLKTFRKEIRFDNKVLEPSKTEGNVAVVEVVVNGLKTLQGKHIIQVSVIGKTGSNDVLGNESTITINNWTFNCLIDTLDINNCNTNWEDSEGNGMKPIKSAWEDFGLPVYDKNNIELNNNNVILFAMPDFASLAKNFTAINYVDMSITVKIFSNNQLESDLLSINYFTNSKLLNFE